MYDYLPITEEAPTLCRCPLNCHPSHMGRPATPETSHAAAGQARRRGNQKRRSPCADSPPIPASAPGTQPLANPALYRHPCRPYCPASEVTTTRRPCCHFLWVASSLQEQMGGDNGGGSDATAHFTRTPVHSIISPVVSFCCRRKSFCAWVRTWVGVRVPTACGTWSNTGHVATRKNAAR